MVAVFDFKLGYSCNNHCRHCVIEDNKPYLDLHNEKYDLTFSDVLKIIESNAFKAANHIVLTGGEPTLRKDFIRVVRSIVERYPDKLISIQTNGRLLGQYLHTLNLMSSNIHYVVALHGLEAVHNSITNNGLSVSTSSNPFKETLKSLFELHNVYGKSNFSHVARIEVVLSKLNLDNICKCVEYLLENGFSRIGISYPHLDGMYINRRNEAFCLGFSYLKLKPVLSELYKLHLKYTDSDIYFEEVPVCMFRHDVVIGNTIEHCAGEVYSTPKFRSMGHDISPTSVKFPNMEINSQFTSTYAQSHKYTDVCKTCRLYRYGCIGTWFESVEMFGDAGFIPLD